MFGIIATMKMVPLNIQNGHIFIIILLILRVLLVQDWMISIICILKISPTKG